jgi:2-isopropylmalate synthase
MTQNGGIYKLVRFDLQSSNTSKSSCVVQLDKDGVILEDVALGDGPIDAAYNAIDKLVDGPSYSWRITPSIPYPKARTPWARLS